MKVWIAIDVGCIECGESSALIGVYTSMQEADVASAAVAECEPDGEGYYSFFTGGQHHTEVFAADTPPLEGEQTSGA